MHDYDGHAFGTNKNRSKVQPIVGRCKVHIPVESGRFSLADAVDLDREVPFALWKNTIRAWQCAEKQDRYWMEITAQGSRLRLWNTLSEKDKHYRLLLTGEDMMTNVAEGMLVALRASTKTEKSIVRRIHYRTHLPPDTVEMLLKRAGKWDSSLGRKIASVQRSCRSCIRSGDPRPSRKFSISKLHLNFNSCVYLDVMYFGGKMAVRVVDGAKRYSQLELMRLRNLNGMMRAPYCSHMVSET